MPKPIIFLSHISEEAEVAGLFKSVITDSFLEMVDVFVSSDPRTLQLGTHWLDEITAALRSCEAMLIFCSPMSIQRPWINFECGAGWARNIEVAPICHSGLRPSDLPLPMNLLQGVVATDKTRIAQVFSMIARKLSSAEPKVDIDRLAQKIADFETRYVHDTNINRHLKAIKSDFVELYDQVLKVITPGQNVPIQSVPERSFVKVQSHFDALQSVGELKYTYGVNGVGFAAPGQSGGGNFGTLTLLVSQRLSEAIKKVE